MPIYRATIELVVEGDNITWLHDTIESLRGMDGVEVPFVLSHPDNPCEFPDTGD